MLNVKIHYQMFHIRKYSKEAINAFIKSIGILLVFLVFLVFLINYFRGSFLNYSKKDFYTPDISKDLGFDGRTNKLLRDLLMDTVVGHNYSLATINEHFNSIKFELNVDSSNNFIRIDDIKIVELICKNEEDRNFYFNSYLHELIEKQKHFSSENYFKISLSKVSGFRIKEITIVPELYKLKLSLIDDESSVNFVNPFEKIDSKCIYLNTANITLPIFHSSKNPSWPTTKDVMVIYQNGIYSNFLDPFTMGVKNTYNLSDSIINMYTNASKGFATTFKPTSSTEEIRLFNNGDGVECIINNFNNVVVFDKGSKKFISLRQGALNRYSHQSLPLKIIYETHAGNKGEFYLCNRLNLNKDTNSICGRYLANNCDLFSNQFANSISNLGINMDSVRQRTCSINPLLSKYLETELKKYVEKTIKNKFPNDIIEASLSIVDAKNGEIQAVPFYSSEFRTTSINLENFKNFNLSKHFIGSTFKPLLANSAANIFPSLSNFSLSNSMFNFNIPTNILGYPIKNPPVKDRSAWTPCPSRSNFLSESHDIYPIALTMLALTEFNDTKPYKDLIRGIPISSNFLIKGNQRLLVKGRYTKIGNLNSSTLVKKISEMYGVPNDNIAYSKSNVYEKIYDSIFLNMPLKNIPNIILPELASLNANLIGVTTPDKLINNISFSDLSSWILGQGANEWTNIHLCQAYARLFTKKEVVCSFWKQNKPFTICKGNLIAWSNFLNDFKNANNTGLLLKPAVDNFNAGLSLAKIIVPSLPDICIVGKTGTPNNYDRKESVYIDNLGKRKWIDEGLYACGILGNYNSANTNGLAIVVHIRRITKNKPLTNGISSKDARDFLSSNVFKNILFYNQNNF
jgi:hypothetical protein